MLNSKEDAIEYIRKMENALNYLAELSKDAGMNGYAAVFHTICGAVNENALKRFMP